MERDHTPKLGGCVGDRGWVGGRADEMPSAKIPNFKLTFGEQAGIRYVELEEAMALSEGKWRQLIFIGNSSGMESCSGCWLSDVRI